MNQEKAQLYHELLVLKAQAGDRTAFETLVGLWQKPFFSYACKFTGHEQAAWDIQQETWLAVIRKFASLSHPSRFKSWAFSILCRKCTDHIRKEYTEKNLKKNYSELLHQKLPHNLEKGSLEDQIHHLEPEQRTLLLLRFNQEMSILEISQTLNIPEGTVKSRLHRTLSELKTTITGELS